MMMISPLQKVNKKILSHPFFQFLIVNFLKMTLPEILRRNGSQPCHGLQSARFQLELRDIFLVLFKHCLPQVMEISHQEVTSGNYFIHLMKYDDGPRCRYFAVNTVMHFCALQIGRIYVNKHPKEMQLSVEELRELIGNKVAMVDSLGLSTISLHTLQQIISGQSCLT